MRIHHPGIFMGLQFLEPVRRWTDVSAARLRENLSIIGRTREMCDRVTAILDS
jgi:hypothetical protein